MPALDTEVSPHEPGLALPDAVPDASRAAVHEAIDPLPEHRRETFLLRARRWWPDLVSGLAPYPDPEQTAGAALELAAAAYAARDADLHRLDAQRALEPDWFQRPDIVGYAAYAERFAREGTGLAGVAERVGHLRELGVRYLHLMPLLAPRPAPNDGGYAVADYRQVRADLGTVEDLRALTSTLRREGIALCLDLVLNHVAREHAWAVAAREGTDDGRYRRYFHIYPDRTVPDAFEATLPEVFPDFAPGNFTWDAELAGWVWTTFNDYQWDLAWDNPEVFCEMADVVLFLANLGVEVLRLDAIAFLWKRQGTSCQNQPEVHDLTQALHALTRIAAPATVFKAEAIVGPADLVAYLGQGRHHGKVSDLAYHNSLMVQIWSMLASRDTRLAAYALSRIPDIPSTTAWITYLRCHDDIGWAIDDRDAGDLGINAHHHRGFLAGFYAGSHPGTFAEGLVFQHNPATGDSRISGTTASLCGLGGAIESGDRERVDDAVARILVGHAIVLAWGGLPVLWSGDEVATLNDTAYAQVAEHAADNRWAHRPRLDPDALELVHADPQGPQGRVWNGLRTMIAARAALPSLHASVPSQALPTPDPGVLGVVRRHPEGVFVALYNLTEQTRRVPGWWLRARGLDPSSVSTTSASTRRSSPRTTWSSRATNRSG